MNSFGSSGIRGVALQELAPADTLDIAQAAGGVFRERNGRVAVGRDSRETGEMMVNAAASGLASVGCHIDCLGVVPTPSLQAYCERRGVPGVMITASHNPPQFNGIKLIGDDGVELTRETLDRVEAYLAEEPELTTWDRTGDVRTVESANQDYQTQLLDAVDRERIADADLTVALDPGHGAGSLTSPKLFGELGCTVKTINAQPDGRFPGRDPEPVADNLTDLGQLVRATDADLGIAHDGDADRAIFFDETGSFVEGDAALAALTAAQIESGETVVSAVNASQRLVDVTSEQDASLELTPIGSTYLITAIRQLQTDGESVSIAGEGNGGIIYPGYRIARDGAYTAARLCELVAETPLSELVESYDGYANVRHNISYDDDSEREAMIAAIEDTAENAGADVDTTDGYRLDYGDAWVLARPSGTEPVVRVYAEARTQKRANTLADEMVDAIES
ncbi:phosphoglucosamine mutase [Halovenus rubra]|uniref:Phosphoglucosamine mutase n=2 Tax=Halovenus rubra TaxID=869890 RepID=A0ACC7E501_9EURY|nr:phosphoglucosamine mutase [Halovenus rubra]